MKKSMFRRSFCAALSAAMLLGVCACSGGTDISGGLSDSTTNLMANVKPEADALSFGKNGESSTNTRKTSRWYRNPKQFKRKCTTS